jgi:hypothetical protein
MKHKKNVLLLHNLVPLFIQEELSLINNEPHVPLSELPLLPYDQSLQLLPEKVPSGGTGFWTGTKSDGTFSGNNCRDWSYGSSGSSDNGTWGSLLINDNSSWINNGTKLCNSNTFFLCFMYN